MSIEKYQKIPIEKFDLSTLKKLQPFFNFELDKNKSEWFQNLLTLSKQNLGLAHCIQHNATARYLVELSCNPVPDFYKTDFSNIIGCYSSHKQMDTMVITNNRVSGMKYWISNLAQANFGIMRIPSGSGETYVLFDFAQTPPDVSFDTDQLGLELARPGTLTVTDYEILPGYCLGQRSFSDNTSPLVHALIFHDYCFITNYLGCIINLYHTIYDHAQAKNLDIDSALRMAKMEIASLKMLWEDNLKSVDAVVVDDKFWHRRNTQYTKSKQLLISLVALSLECADSSWTMMHTSTNQNFRDALVYCTHMQSLHKALVTKQFVEI